ncbi:MAG: crossover junction endodeoxyribonuclease RuvC [Patescibacteria group bacterium]
MRILAIDPGYERMGAAILEKQRGKEIFLFSVCIRTSAKDVFPKRLAVLGSEVEKIIDEWHPDALAIETLLFNSNQKTAMRVAEARGVVVYIAAARGLPVYEYTPLQVKTGVTGYGRAPKEQVAALVRALLGLQNMAKYDDETDAIAIGLTALASISTTYPQG